MTFLNPLMLLGLGLIAVPVIIHMFNLRKARRVDFSSLMFVRRIEETEIKKLRLKEIILLLIRILLITFLVLSFANPFLKSRFSVTDIKNKTAILFLDNSFSMNNKSVDRNNFEKCKSSALEISGFYNPTYNLRIFQGSRRQMMVNNISGTGISHKPLFFNELLETVNINLEKEKSVLNEVIVVSDFSRINFRKYTGFGNFPLDMNNVYFYLLDVSERQTANVSIQEVKLVNEFVDLNTDMVFGVSIKNHNDFPVPSAEFEIRNNSNVVYSGNLDFNPGELKEFEIKLKPASYGEQKIESYITVSDPAGDEIKEDNKFYNVVNIPESYKIMLVTDKYENADYIAKSFDIFNSSGESGRIIYGLKNIISDEIFNYDALYIIKSGFTESDINTIEKYLASGKGIFLFPPDNADLQSLNSLLNRISSFRLETKQANAENVKISEIKTEHPLFRGVFKVSADENYIQNPESPVFISYYKILSGENTYPVITFDNGSTFISEYLKGNSRIILSALSPDFVMSDLPAKNFFLPMIIRGVFLLSGNDDILRTGRINSGFFVNEMLYANDTVYKPDGAKVVLSDSAVNNLSAIMNLHFNRNGFCRIVNSKSRVKSFAVNNDVNESLVQKVDENYALEYFKSIGFPNVLYFNDIGDLKSAVEKNRNGIELTPVFLILTVIFIFLEIIYSAFILRRK